MDRSRLDSVQFQQQVNSLPYYCSSNSYNENDHASVLPAEHRHVGFWKGEQEANDATDNAASAYLDLDSNNLTGLQIINDTNFPKDLDFSKDFISGGAEGAVNSVDGGDLDWRRRDSCDIRDSRDWLGFDSEQNMKNSVDRLLSGDRRTGVNTLMGSYSWSGSGDLQGGKIFSSHVHHGLPLHRNGVTHHGLASSPRSGLDMDVNNNPSSSSFATLFESKLSLVDGALFRANAASMLDSDLEGRDREEQLRSLEELESHTIGRLLPDDEEELFAGMVEEYDRRAQASGSGSLEETEDFDLFSSGGGLELEGEGHDGLGFGGQKGSDSYSGTSGQLANSVSSNALAGEHPFGEHPSRTLFVRNINSNVEDSELRTLFEQYGAIRTLYTACKHRGFVMISYYDIRAARSAMRALQNKPLRRRKLDIHFSIPKENPSDKDVNQGTLVVFNLDASVSNDELRQIFGVYGEVKEIRETPHKRHHKFVEFYDVRAAESALRALNRSDIAGKRIKLEPSRPGGARRSLIQHLNSELDQEETRSQRLVSQNSLTSSPPVQGSPWGSSPALLEAEIASSRNFQGSHTSPSSLVSALYKSLSSAQGSSSSGVLVGSPNAGSASLPPHPLAPGRTVSASSLVGLQSQHEASTAQTLTTSNLASGLSRLPPQHPHSLPDLVSGMISQGHYGQASALATAATAAGLPMRGREGGDGSLRLPRASSTSALALPVGDSLFDHTKTGLGSSSFGAHQFLSNSSLGGGGSTSSSATGNQSYIWGTSGSSSFRQSLQNPGSPPLVWPVSHENLFQQTPGQEAYPQSLVFEQGYPQSLDPMTYSGIHGNGLEQGYPLTSALEQAYSQSVARASQAINQVRSHASAQTPHTLTSSRSHNHELALQRGMLGGHHVGSDSLLLDRRYSFLAESQDNLVRGGSPGAVGSSLGGTLGGGHGTSLGNSLSGSGGSARDNSLDRYRLGGMSNDGGFETGPSSPSMLSPQVRNRGHSVGSGSQSQLDNYGDRTRGRRAEQSSIDGKKQYQLDLDRIMRGEDPRTTLMIKNIPNKYTQKMLLAAIDEHHRGSYDFFYLPIDFKNKCNVGYAFINMMDPYKIVPFFQAFNGKKWEKFNSEKVALLAYARIQGKNALVAHFQNSSLMNEDKRCRPILFHSEGPHAGDQEPFPVGMNVRARPNRDRSNGLGGSHQGSPATSCSSRDDSTHGGSAFGSSSNILGFIRIGSRARDGDELSPDF